MVRYEYGNKDATHVLVQMVGEHELSGLKNEIDLIRQEAGNDFSFIAFLVKDWNRELSPWTAAPVFGKEGFGDGAGDTLASILSELNDNGKKYYLGGYSLAGLFALWSGYQTDVFSGIAAASPSIWFPGFIDYMQKETFHPDMVYLSLGDREEKTKNAVMSKVGDGIRQAYKHFQGAGIKTVLEWNEGNHFKDADVRTAKAFAWLLKAIRYSGSGLGRFISGHICQ